MERIEDKRDEGKEKGKEDIHEERGKDIHTSTPDHHSM